MKHFSLSKRTFLLTTLLSLALMTAQVASAASVNDETWRIVKSPNGSLNTSELFGMTALSEEDAWAVGVTFTSPQGSPAQALIEHWNGSQWSIVPSPNPGSDNGLNGLAAISPNDIWAVGSVGQFGTPTKTLIEHWNGSQWSIVPSPNPGLTHNLFGAVAISKNNVWAGGSYETSGGSFNTLVLHWNGSQWSVVPSPNSGSNNELNNLADVSANDIWAVGDAGGAATVIEHWNGSQWSIVPSPNVGSNGNVLIGVTVLSERNIWATGFAINSNNIQQTLIEHWNGTRWSVVASPNVGSNGSGLTTVSAISAIDIWTVGAYVLANGNTQNLVEHWNGTRWSVVPSPNVGGNDFLGASAAVSANDVWAVGTFTASTGFLQTLIEHCC